MTNPEIEPEAVEPENIPAETTAETPVEPAIETDAETEIDEEVEKDERKRRLLLLLLLLLLLCLCCVCGFIFRYWLNPQALPDMILPPQASVCYSPTYKFSIKNVDGPVSVAGSPDDQRLYVAEGAGQRLEKVYDRNGNLLTTFAPPGTNAANREPKYMAVSPDGRVFLVDRTSSSIGIYDADGRFIDAIIGQQMTLSKYLTGKIGALPTGTIFTHYEGINKILTYQLPGQGAQKVEVTFPADEPQWSPLGLRFDVQGNLIYTDTTPELHSVHIIPAAALNIYVADASVDGTATPVPTPTGVPINVNAPLATYNPQIKEFGTSGQEKDRLSFPQTVVLDSAGNFYISDGNNTRIDVWTPDMQYKTYFGFGTSVNGALNLPRGTWMGPRGCLLVADAVGSVIRVYNVSGEQPVFSLQIGSYGLGEGLFNYPVDVYIDGTGRLYVADRANNRIQVWSY